MSNDFYHRKWVLTLGRRTLGPVQGQQGYLLSYYIQWFINDAIAWVSYRTYVFPHCCLDWGIHAKGISTFSVLWKSTLINQWWFSHYILMWKEKGSFLVSLIFMGSTFMTQSPSKEPTSLTLPHFGLKLQHKFSESHKHLIYNMNSNLKHYVSC